jgi:hypothetical protein
MVVNILLRTSAAFLAFLMLGGCGSGEFSPNGTLESRPVQLDGEQVVLDQGQVDCGAHEELWDIAPLGDGRSVGRLTQKGRDLQFSDDVQIGDPVVGVPYVQIHGTFPVKVFQVGSVRDQDAYTKLADARVTVRIDHACFQTNPPVLMGIRHRQFDPSASPVFRFKLDGAWMVDQIVH